MGTQLERYIESIELAAKQFKLAYQISWAATDPSREIPQPLIGATYGQSSIGDSIRQSPEDVAQAGAALFHSSTFILVIVVDTAFEHKFPKGRIYHTDDSIRIPATIARMIRNAYSHDPFFPKWVCTDKSYVGRFEIPGVITVDTSRIEEGNNESYPIDWTDYGGPLKLLSFALHCRDLLREP